MITASILNKNGHTLNNNYTGGGGNSKMMNPTPSTATSGSVNKVNMNGIQKIALHKQSGGGAHHHGGNTNGYARSNSRSSRGAYSHGDYQNQYSRELQLKRDLQAAAVQRTRAH